MMDMKFAINTIEVIFKHDATVAGPRQRFHNTNDLCMSTNTDVQFSEGIYYQQVLLPVDQ